MKNDPNNPARPLDADAVTWAVLFGRWTDFARSAVALPKDGEGGLLRDSVADLIGLQAVWFALKHIEDLASSERRLGLDRAQVLIDRYADALYRRFEAAGMPASIEELITDANAQLALAKAED